MQTIFLRSYKLKAQGFMQHVTENIYTPTRPILDSFVSLFLTLTPCTLPLDPPLAPTLFPNSFSTGRPHPFHYVSFHYLQKNFRVDHNPIPMFSLITVATTGQQQVTILTTLNTTDGFHSDVIKL